MGAALQAVGDTGKLLRHNTVLWALGGVVTVVFFVVYGVLNFIPLVGPFLGLFIIPVFVTGVLGLAYAGRNGNARPGDFTSSVADNYVPYLASLLVLWGISFAVSLVVTVVFFFVVGFGTMGASASAGAGAGSQGAGAGGLLAGLGIVMVILLLVVFVLSALAGLALQFFDVATVAGDAGPIEAFKQSVSLLLGAPVSVVGYTLLRAVLGTLLFAFPFVLITVVGAGVGAVASGPGASESLSMVVLLGFAVWGLVVLPVGTVVLLTYHVAYFNRYQAQGTV